MYTDRDRRRRKTERYRAAERERRRTRLSDPAKREKERARQRAKYAERTLAVREKKVAAGRACVSCGSQMPVSLGKGRPSARCLGCRTAHRKEWAARYLRTSRGRLWYLRLSAKQRGIPFALKEADLPPIPAVCPALGVPFSTGPFQLTLDRIDNEAGYVPGNVQWLSRRANAIKSDASLHELEAVVSFVRSVLQKHDNVVTITTWPENPKSRSTTS